MMEVEDFIEQVSAPMFRYRMAKPIVESPEKYEDRLVKGAMTKIENAQAEIASLLEKVWEVDEISYTSWKDGE